jgi:hypothetical protein
MKSCLLLNNVIVLVLIICVMSTIFGCTAATPTAPNYLYALDGLTVTTTRYHPDVVPPPPSMKYPSVFYEASSIGRIPPTVTGSLTLAPYGQESHAQGSSISVFEGTVVDVLVQANVDVFVGLAYPGSVGIDVNGMLPETVGLSTTFGFFYENQATLIVSGGKETKQHSTAMRTAYAYPGNYRITFDNYSTNQVQVTYSIWIAGNVSNFHDYLDQCESIWESGKYTEELAKNMQATLKEALMKNW